MFTRFVLISDLRTSIFPVFFDLRPTNFCPKLYGPGQSDQGHGVGREEASSIAINRNPFISTEEGDQYIQGPVRRRSLFRAPLRADGCLVSVENRIAHAVELRLLHPRRHCPWRRHPLHARWKHARRHARWRTHREHASGITAEEGKNHTTHN